MVVKISSADGGGPELFWMFSLLPQVVGVETEKVSKEKAVADEEEHKVAAIAVTVTAKQKDCEEDLAKAEPALIAAQEALNTLNKVGLLAAVLASLSFPGSV